jgi:hypothetical protein
MTEGLAREGFDKDLLFGQAREDAFLRRVLGGTYLEHKSDQRARETGNLFIEYETSTHSRGLGEIRPSGISVTKAELWAIEFDDDSWIFCPTERIRHLKDEAVHRAMTVWGGDYNRFHGALVPLVWVVRAPQPKPQGALL